MRPMATVFAGLFVAALGGCQNGNSGYAGDGASSSDARSTTEAGLVLTPDDQDGDHVPNSRDNCPKVYNPDQLDFDNDGVGDPCDADPPLETCGDTKVASARLAPNLLVVLDRSKSMDSNNKWTQAGTALKTLSDQLAAQLRLGLALFAGEAQNCAAPDLELPVGLHSATDFQATYARKKPAGYTPMRRALETVRTSNWLTDAKDPDDAKRSKNVLLVTDGQPNCAVDHESDINYSDIDATLQQAKLLHDAGAFVYVVGFGNGVDATALNDLAKNGGTDNLADPKNRYFQANDEQQLADALLAIGAQVSSCTLTLEGRPGAPDRIYVVVGDKATTRDDPNGFSYDATNNTIELKGTTCTAVKGPSAPAIQVIFGCPPGGGLPVIK